MTSTPFIVHPPTPAPSNWGDEESAWSILAKGIVSDGSFDSLTIKALYITGLVYDLCSAVNILLAPENPTTPNFYPAYTIFASTIELLGRCITGNATDRSSGNDLISGFQWLVSSSIETLANVPEDSVWRDPGAVNKGHPPQLRRGEREMICS